MTVLLRLDEAVAVSAGVSRSRARALIMAGRVRVDGRIATKAGERVRASSRLEVARPSPYVSRGGEKLERALDAFAIGVKGKRALDVGASTGGFTDCLLVRGAEHIVAIDVGYGQLAYSLRIDPRVTVVERCNFRLLSDDAFEQPFDVITIDASFISVKTMIARALGYLVPGGDIVALVKPQFEAGRARLGGGGVVRDPAVHRDVLVETLDAIAGMGAVAAGLIRSPLRGPAGNLEFFVHVRRDGVPVDLSAVSAALA